MSSAPEKNYSANVNSMSRFHCKL